MGNMMAKSWQVLLAPYKGSKLKSAVACGKATGDLGKTPSKTFP